MKSESFVKLLRKVIREEVTRAVRTEMKELLQEKKVDHKKVISHGMNLNNIVSKQPRKQKQYVKDRMLNDILNSTGPLQENRAMNFNSGMAQSFKSMMSTDPGVPHVAPVTKTSLTFSPNNNSSFAFTANEQSKAVKQAVPNIIALCVSNSFGILIKKFESTFAY